MIEHTTFAQKVGIFETDDNYDISLFKSFLNAILSAYEWGSGSAVTDGSNLPGTYGIYYFTNDSYMKIYSYVRQYDCCDIKIDFVNPNGSKTVYTGIGSYVTFSVGKTSKGICLCVYSGASNDTRDPHFYNLYVGEIKTLDGQTTKGCIYDVADDNSYTVATDSGISNEAKFASTIDNTKKTCLIPVTDSTTGAVFKNIFMLKNAPLNYNRLKINDTQKIYLCGKAICLED